MLYLEMGRELLKSYMEIERIFATRKNESGGKDYFVKWKNLAYSEATWEDEFNITNYYQENINIFDLISSNISNRFTVLFFYSYFTLFLK